MGLVKLNIVGLSYSQFKSGAYALFLEEDNGLKKLSIVIGQCEAQAIAIGLDKNISSPRPLTHDLFVSIAEKNNLILDKIIIHKLEKGIFYSSILFINKKSNHSFSIDSRTSDAIAIAIRFNSGIFTYKEILDESQNYFKENNVADKKTSYKSEEKRKTEIVQDSLNDLEKKLNHALQTENYELAAKIRDQIKQIK